MVKAKLDIKPVLMAIDNRTKGFWEKLSDDDKKAIEPFLLMIFTSSVKTNSYDIEHYYLNLTNEFVNKHFNIVRHHPELQFKLIQCVGLGSKQYHPWLTPSKKKRKTSNLLKWLEEMYPTYNDEELELLLTLNSKDDLKNLAEDMGLDKKEIKDIFK